MTLYLFSAGNILYWMTKVVWKGSSHILTRQNTFYLGCIWYLSLSVWKLQKSQHFSYKEGVWSLVYWWQTLPVTAEGGTAQRTMLLSQGHRQPWGNARCLPKKGVKTQQKIKFSWAPPFRLRNSALKSLCDNFFKRWAQVTKEIK